jgi:hypothetical protein
MSADLYAAFVAADGDQYKSRGVTKSTAGNASEASSSRDPQDAQGSSQTWDTPSKVSLKAEASSLWSRDATGSDILFDAEELGNDDEFGEFETVSTPGANVSVNGGVCEGSSISINRTTSEKLVPDLLNADDVDVPLSSGSAAVFPHVEELRIYQERRKPEAAAEVEENNIESAWEEEWGDLEYAQPHESLQRGLNASGRHETQRPQPQPQPQTAPNDEDEWEAFEDGKLEPPAQQTSPNPLPATLIRPQHKSPPATSVPTFERPTNVPPPSSLLQLLSAVFEEIRQHNVTDKTSKPELATKVLVVFRTANRLVAGRSLRWKRDTLLSQSMRIGQAGKSGGMKLTSVNKSENAKEERDAEEMIREWMTHVHEYNSIIAQAGLQPHRIKISSSPSLKTFKYSGTSGSSRQCALCGLKRTERLVDVDVDVDDIFGEFWTEHWGHKDCYDFWYSYKGLLGQR